MEEGVIFYRQVAGKPPAAPSGPHDCEDVHVRARPIRLSTSDCKVTQPLSILPQSTDQCPTTLVIMATKTTRMTATKITLATMQGGR
jgi:hypothetical protein